MEEKLSIITRIINDTLQYNQTGNSNILIPEKVLIDNGLNNSDIALLFKKLVEERVIKFKEISEPPVILPSDYFKESYFPLERYVNQLIHLMDIDTEKFSVLYKTTQNKKSLVPSVNYNIETGIGYCNDKKFKFKNSSPEFKAFKGLYNNLGKSISKDYLLSLSPDKIFSPNMKTYFINNLAKKIREKTGLNKDQLVLNAGTLTLVVEKLENPPELP